MAFHTGLINDLKPFKMKKKNNSLFKSITLFVLFSISITVYISCRKTNDQSVADQMNTNLTKEWLHSLKQQASASQKLWLDSLEKGLDFTKMQSTVYLNEENLLSIPITIEVSPKAVFANKIAGGNSLGNSLVIIKEKDNSIKSSSIVLLSSAGSSENESTGNRSELIKKLLHSSLGKSSFTGKMATLSVYKDFVSQAEYINGIQNKLNQAKTKAEVNANKEKTNVPGKNYAPTAQGDGEPGSGCIDWYWVVITYDDNGNVQTRTETYLFTDCPPADGGGGGGGNGGLSAEQEQCLQTALTNFDTESGGGNSTSQLISETTTDIDGITKAKHLQWKCFNGAGGGWTLLSNEDGTVTLADPAHDTWYWQTFNHTNITFSGMAMAGAAISWTNGTGTPLFVNGTPNIIYESMALSFAVTYKFVCNCWINEILPLPDIVRQCNTVSPIYSAHP